MLGHLIFDIEMKYIYEWDSRIEAWSKGNLWKKYYK